MATENEPAKLLLPYLQRADELQKHEPLVAYYCRLYAMEQGLKIPQSDRSKTTNALLVSLMNQLEKDKKSLKLGPDDHLHVEGFALNVFAKADKQDRAERADLNTAKTFYAASIFFEILNQFGELQPDKQKYAAWKAADIRKALKEGKMPVPGPSGEDKDLSLPSSTSSGEYDLQTSRNDFTDSAARTVLTRVDSASRTAPDSDLSQPYDHDNLQHATNFSRRPSNSTHSPSSSISPPSHYPTDSCTKIDSGARTVPDSDPSPQAYDHDNFQHSSNFSQLPSNVMPSPSLSISSPSHYPTDSYPSENIQLPSTNTSEHSIYHHQSHQHQPYQPEFQQHLPQHYPSHDVPPFSYPNFQSYPSFTDSSLPAAPSHHPSYYQGSDASYSSLSPSNTAGYTSTPQYNSSGRNGSVPEVSPPTTEKYEYDSSYQPPPDKIAEAHKAARFAVGALAFDDVSTAVDYLKKSLELLTNQSAGH